MSDQSPSAPSMMRYARALGWGALAGAPILLAALGVAAARPQAPGSLFGNAMWVAWITGALAFVAAILSERGARRASRALATFAGFVAVLFCIFLLWLSVATRPRVAALDERERADLERVELDSEIFLRHPVVGIAFPDPGRDLDPAPQLEGEAAAVGGADWARAHRLFAWEGHGTQVVVDLSRVERADDAAVDAALFEIVMPLRRGRNIVRRADDGWIEVELVDGGYSLSRILVTSVDGRAYRVVVGVVSRDRARWRAWLERARIEPRLEDGSHAVPDGGSTP